MFERCRCVSGVVEPLMSEQRFVQPLNGSDPEVISDCVHADLHGRSPSNFKFSNGVACFTAKLKTVLSFII